MRIGILLCSEVRNALDLAKFNGFDIEYFESTGWIERDFIVKGNADHIKQLYPKMKKFFETDD